MRTIFTCLIILTTQCVFAQSDRVQTGSDRLVQSNFEEVSGATVGVIVNHTTLVGDQHLVTLIHSSNEVTLGAIFGPEHGFRGTAGHGEEVKDGVDQITGAPVYSLYGPTKKPTMEMLENLDLLIFDIQDVGARFYTYISTMGLAMQSATEAGIPFVVLDRPNPLSGHYVSGFVLEPEMLSFVGQFAIPITHGLTVGELARMIQGEALLPDLESLDLRIIPMEGWSRSMQWPDTGLPWVPTSPNIPTFETALVYPGTCFFEATSGSEGRGTMNPFLQVGAIGTDGQQIATTLNAKKLPGVRFELSEFTPEPLGSMKSAPKLNGQSLQGLRVQITDRKKYQPVESGIHILHAYYSVAPDPEEFLSRPEWLGKLSGTSKLASMLKTIPPEEIISSWQSDVAEFIQKSEEYHLYQ